MAAAWELDGVATLAGSVMCSRSCSCSTSFLLEPEWARTDHINDRDGSPRRLSRSSHDGGAPSFDFAQGSLGRAH
jgi:hypothetical protein